MKTLTYYSALLLCLVCFSCKKEQSSQQVAPKTSTKLYPVTFSLSSFSSQITNLSLASGLKNTAVRASTTSPSLKDTISSLYYIVYDVNASTHIIRKLLQTSDAANFGTIKDSLAAGTYIISLAGGGSYFNAFVPIGGHESPDVINFYYSADPVAGTAWKDSFLSQFNFTVSDTTSKAVRHVTLPRIVAQLQVNLTDTIPANAARIELAIQNEMFSYPKTSTRDTAVYKLPVTAAMVGQVNYQFNTYTTNYTAPFTAVLSAYDASGNRIAAKTINNITCKQNMRTVLTGKLFNGIPTVGFGITANQTWGGTINKSF